MSLEEQRAAIKRYAEKNEIEITDWFEEVQTAAKKGRPRFTAMLRLLRKGKAHGVVIHKIDRSARNLRDWADLGELLDRGIAVYFANESLDLHTRGGRLSADIQAIVAADYIRNLREETLKGFYGRLKQGIYPLMAPLGYLDNGGGEVKTICPQKGPLVRLAFELYATGEYNLESLGAELYKRGLRNKRGNAVSKNGLSTILNNPFYIGVIRIKRTRESFEGAHESLISTRLFEQVQGILRGKTNTKTKRHDFTFRRLLTCAGCGKRLRGELQKGYVYYRCHTKECSTKCVREEVVDVAVEEELGRLRLLPAEKEEILRRAERLLQNERKMEKTSAETLRVRAGEIRGRLDRLTDAYIDGLLAKDIFEERRHGLLLEERKVREAFCQEEPKTPDLLARIQKIVERADTALLSYRTQTPLEKQDLVRLTTSNRQVHGRNVSVELCMPFSLLADEQPVTYGGPKRDKGRTKISSNHSDRAASVVAELVGWVKRGKSARQEV